MRNSRSGQRVSPCRTIVWKASAAADICREGSLEKRIWFGKNNTEFSFFFVAKLYSKTFVGMLLPNVFTELCKPQVIYVF